MNPIREKIIQGYRRAFDEYAREGFYWDGDIEKPALKKYCAEHHAGLASFEALVKESELISRMRESQVVYWGDFHPLRATKLNFVDAIREGLDTKRSQEVVIALEDLKPRDQAKIDDYLSNELNAEELKLTTQEPHTNGASSFTGIVAILDLARGLDLDVRGINAGGNSLPQRGQRQAAEIDRILEEYDHPQVWVLAGEYHLARCHVPKAVHSVSDLVVFQNAEPIFWQLQEAGQEYAAKIIRIFPRTYFFNHTPPLLRAMIHANSGEEIEERLSAAEVYEAYVQELQEIMRGSLGLPPSKRAKVRVVTFEEPELEKTLRDCSLTSNEIKRVTQLAKGGSSSCVPEHNLVYLASQDMVQVAEELAHGLHTEYSKVDDHGSSIDLFYKSIMMEALGFLGSKLMDPSRKPLTLAKIREQDRALGTRVTSFIHGRGGRYGFTDENIRRLSDRTRQAVQDYLGYGLGNKLYVRLEDQILTPKTITGLFLDNLNGRGVAQAVYQQLEQI